MKSVTAYRVAFSLGLLSTVATVAAGMAIQDIYHGEPDLRLEWSVLRVSFLVVIAFHACALAALWRTIGVFDSDAATRGEGDQPKVV